MATVQSVQSVRSGQAGTGDLDHEAPTSPGLVLGSADGPRSWPDCEWTEEMRTEAIELFQRALSRDGAGR